MTKTLPIIDSGNSRINDLIYSKNSDLNCQLEANNNNEDIDLLSLNNLLIISQSRQQIPDSYLLKYDDQFRISAMQFGSQYSACKTSKEMIRKKTYKAIMVYFNIKKFIQKLTETIRQTVQLSEQQLFLIGDISTNKSTFQAILNSQKNQSHEKKPNILNMMKLIQVEESHKNKQMHQSLKHNIELKINRTIENLIKFIESYIQRIPLIEPDSKYKLIWNILTALVRTYFIYWIPIEITYKPLFLFGEGVIATVILLIILIIDVLIRLNTVFYQQGQAIRSRWEILTLQLRNTLLEDTLSYLPLVMYTIIGYTNWTQVIQFVHLLFFYQFKYISKVFTQVENQLHLMNRQYQYILSITKLVSLLLYILHLFSCFQFFIAELIDQEQNWIIYRNLQNQSWFSQYTDSFYYSTVTMLTIGYGDIVPQNDYEKIIAIFFMLFSCIWLSYCVNTVGTILQSMSQNKLENKEKMVQINKYMEQRNISYKLQYKIKQYLNYRWEQETAEDINQQKKIIDQLSNELKEELFEETVSIMIHQCPLFLHQFSSQFKKKLIPHIQERFIEPDTIFNNDFDGINLLIVEQGQIEVQFYIFNFQVYMGPSKKFYNNGLLLNKSNYMYKGSSIGVIEFLTDQVTKQNYRANGFVTLLSIDKKVFLNFLKDFPGDAENYYQLRDSYMYQKSNPLQIRTKCISCNQFNHDVITCPKVHLIINQEVAIKKENFPITQKRNSDFIRKPQNFYFQSKKDQQIMEEYSQIFRDENKLLLENQLKNQIEYICSSDSDENPSKKQYQKNENQDIQRAGKKIQTNFDLKTEKDFSQNSQEQKMHTLKVPEYKINILAEDETLINNFKVKINPIEFPISDQEEDKEPIQQMESFTPSNLCRNPEKRCVLISDPKKQLLKHKSTYDISEIEEKLEKRKFKRHQSRHYSKLIQRVQEEDTQFFKLIYEFNESQAKNVQKIYQKIQEVKEEKRQVPLDIFLLYKKLEKKKKWDSDIIEYEENMKDFQKYMVEFNYSQVLSQLQKSQQSIYRNDYDIFRKLMSYMMYPWVFIQNYVRKDFFITDAVLDLKQNQKREKQRQLRNQLKIKSEKIIKLRRAVNVVKASRRFQKKIHPEQSKITSLNL